MQERDFKGIWIPREIWLASELTLLEKIFLVEIDSLDNEQNCYASNAYFAEFFGISKGRCTQIIKSLEAKGFITVTPDENSGRQKVVRLTPEGQRARNEAIISATPAFEQLFQSQPAEAMVTLISELEKIRKVLDESRT